MSTRRSFLSLVAAAYAAAVFPRCLFAEQTGTAIFTNASLGSYAQGTMTRATFEKLIGQVFTAFHANGDVSYLTLTNVEPISEIASATARQPQLIRSSLASTTTGISAMTGFHLSFSTTGVPVTQDTLLLDHGTLGRVAVFVVPGQAGTSTCGATFLSLAVGPNTTPQTLRPTRFIRLER